MKKIIFFSIFFILHNTLPAQSIDLKKFSIMPIPYTKSDQGLIQLFEENNEYRVAMAQITESFLNAGFYPIDFEAKMRKARHDKLFRKGDQPEKIKERLIRLASPDIYVETEINEISDPSSGEKKVRLTLSAYFTSTSAAIASTYEETNWFTHVDVVSLTKRAIVEAMPRFNKMVTDGLDHMIKNGVSFQVDFSIDTESELSFYDVFKDTTLFNDELQLKDFIILWLDEKTKSIDIRGEDEKLLIFSDVKISILDEDGNLVSPIKFRTQFWKYLKSLQSTKANGMRLKVEPKSVGNTLYYTIRY